MATLNNEEVDALMNAIREGEVRVPPSQPADGTVVAYDLTSQDRIIRGQMPTLDAINERAASVFGTSLAGRTRLDLRVTSAPAALMKFGDVSMLLAPPASVCVLSLGPGHGLALIILDGTLADTLLAAALGDRKARPEARGGPGRRDLTTVERLVLRKLLGMLCEALGTSWSPVIALSPEILRFESDPRLCNITPPNDMTILTTFEVSGVFSGRLHFVIPYAAVEGVRKMLSAPPRAGAGGNERFLQQMSDEIRQVNVEIRAILGGTKVRLEELLSLKNGDILTLDTAENDAVPVLIQGRPKMTGLPQILNGSLAVRVVQPLDQDEAPPVVAPPVMSAA